MSYDCGCESCENHPAGPRDAAQILRDARPDPYTKKASFLLGWDAAIAELERMK